MSTKWGWLAFVCVIAMGCGDDDDKSDMTIGKDFSAALVDFANSPFAGVHCGDMSCPDQQVCCVRPSGQSFHEACESPMSCMAGGAAAVCDGSEDCPAGMTDCCAQVTFMRTGPNSAVPSGGSSACVNACAASVLADSNNITFNSKLCHANTDCAGFMGDIYGTSVPFDGCCYRPEIDLRFCAPSDPSYKNIGGYYCLTM